MTQDMPLCAHCSMQTGGCCHTDAASVPYCFPLSEPEIDRLIPYAGFARTGPGQARVGGREAVCVQEPNTPDFIATMQALFPEDKARVQRLFPQGGHHYRLPLLPASSEMAKNLMACAFLGPAGCCLPRQARPCYCLLYPGWVQGKLVTLFQAKECLAAHDATSPAQGLARIGLSQRMVRELFAKLKHDWGFAD